MSRIFTRRKRHEVKNQEALDLFREHNRLAPSTRAKYRITLDKFIDFLLLHKKSLWDADFQDVRKFFATDDSSLEKSALSTFYRTLISIGEYKRENPIVQLAKYEREMGEVEEEAVPIDETERVLREYDTEIPGSIAVQRETKKKRERIGKKILTLNDLDNLCQRASHIRDRAILEFMYATGARNKEIVNLKLSYVNLERRQVTIENNNNFRVLILPKRTINFLKIYERWRRRKLSPSIYYFITKGDSKKQMNNSTISNWLRNMQKDRPRSERWTTSDFRKRAILHHYWITRDITAVARFAGYAQPESALNVIAQIVKEQGVESIDMLKGLPEFEQMQSKQRTATVDDDQLNVTLQLRPEDLDYIRSTGQTPTQLFRTILSLGSRIGVTPGVATGAPGSPAAAAGPGPGGPPAGGPSSGPTGPPGGGPTGPPTGGPSSGPTGPPTMGGGGAPKITTAPGGPNLGGAPSGGPSLGKAPAGGPNLGAAPSGGPSLGKGPSGPPGGGPTGPPGGGGAPSSDDIGSMLSSLKKAPGGGPSAGPGGPPAKKEAPPMDQATELKMMLERRKKRMAEGGPAEPAPEEKKEEPMTQMNELQQRLAARRKRMAEGSEEPTPSPGSDLGAVISDVEPDRRSRKKDDVDDDLPDIPDMDF